MSVVFVHGWGFDAGIWDGVAAALPGVAQRRVELGFLGGVPSQNAFTAEDVLIGHSLGLLWGLSQFRDWQRVVAINAFARFAEGEGAAVSTAALRAMRRSLTREPQKALENFHRSLGHETVIGEFDAVRLAEGLAFLAEAAFAGPATVPCLVLAGDRDPLVPPAASAYLATALKAQIRWRENGGHLLPLADPAWCAAQIRAFLA